LQPIGSTESRDARQLARGSWVSYL
jgi:hypothetical protein